MPLTNGIANAITFIPVSDTAGDIVRLAFFLKIDEANLLKIDETNFFKIQ